MTAEIVAFPFSRRVHHLESQAANVVLRGHDADRAFLKLANKRYQRLIEIGIPEPEVFAECSSYYAALWAALNREAYLQGWPGVPPKTLARGKPTASQASEPTTQTEHDDEVQQWKELARWCHAHKGALNEKERAFIGNMAFVTETATEKQITWLNDIFTELSHQETA